MRKPKKPDSIADFAKRVVTSGSVVHLAEKLAERTEPLWSVCYVGDDNEPQLWVGDMGQHLEGAIFDDEQGAMDFMIALNRNHPEQAPFNRVMQVDPVNIAALSDLHGIIFAHYGPRETWVSKAFISPKEIQA